MIRIYPKNNSLTITELGRGSTWLDTGTSKDILKAGNYIDIIEERQNQKIACLEEISFRKGWINKKLLNKRIIFYGKNDYSNYISEILNN